MVTRVLYKDLFGFITIGPNLSWVKKLPVLITPMSMSMTMTEYDYEYELSLSMTMSEYIYDLNGQMK